MKEGIGALKKVSISQNSGKNEFIRTQIVRRSK